MTCPGGASNVVRIGILCGWGATISPSYPIFETLAARCAFLRPSTSASVSSRRLLDTSFAGILRNAVLPAGHQQTRGILQGDNADMAKRRRESAHIAGIASSNDGGVELKGGCDDESIDCVSRGELEPCE